MKKIIKKKYLILALLLILPSSSLAFFSFGGDLAILGKILLEATKHTMALQDVIGQISFINKVQDEMREGINDPLALDIPSLVEREESVKDFFKTRSISPLINRIPVVGDLQMLVQRVWGAFPKTAPPILNLKDEQVLYSLSHAAKIAEESEDFARSGEELLGDLDFAKESKATLRGAQAGAIQVQQLAQIQANQGLQISLQAQSVLNQTEGQKAALEVADQYLEMLDKGFGSLKPLGGP